MQLVLGPAPAGSGVTFRRRDLDPVVAIPALAEYVGDTTLSTSLVKDGHRVSTVEHLLAAMAGMGIDNEQSQRIGEMAVRDPSAQGNPIAFTAEQYTQLFERAVAGGQR